MFIIFECSLKYRPNYPAVEHLVVHELTHLQLIIEAREVSENMLFISNESYKSNFKLSLKKYKSQLLKKGIPEASLNKVIEDLFSGLNRQIYNTPIDLFIEDRIYRNYKDLRPYQFLSLMNLIKEGIKATTRKDIVDNAPVWVLDKSKTYNLVNAIQFKNLYGIDLVSDHNPTHLRKSRAETFYDEFKEYRKDKKPAEEYEIVQHWGEDLDLDNYFELVSEIEFFGTSDINKTLDSIENEEYELTISQHRQVNKFLESHKGDDINNAVVFYMIDALNRFDNLNDSTIQKIAFEFATLGMGGIDPAGEDYSIPYYKERKFSGYETLSNYYVSWMLHNESMAKQLGLPFEKEYKIARKLKSEI